MISIPMMISTLVGVILSTIIFSSSASNVGLVSKLGTYNISTISVSGLSSGAYMAVQVHVAFSSIINGAGIFAGVRHYLENFLNIIYV